MADTDQIQNSPASRTDTESTNLSSSGSSASSSEVSESVSENNANEPSTIAEEKSTSPKLTDSNEAVASPSKVDVENSESPALNTSALASSTAADAKEDIQPASVEDQPKDEKTEHIFQSGSDGDPTTETTEPPAPDEASEAATKDAATPKPGEGGSTPKPGVDPSASPEVPESTTDGTTTEEPTTEATTTEMTTTEPPKELYPIEIPLDKKITAKQRRKLWEEIEKRKPLIPKHVAAHITKYAKPPFETCGSKYKSRSGVCFGCSK